MSVSKVIFGTETLIDITDTTATAEDVAEGKYFLTASGVLTEGTGTGGGGTEENHTITIDSLSKSVVDDTIISTIPYDYRSGNVLIYENEIHILGSSMSFAGSRHYKWNGTSWTSVSTIPYYLTGIALVYNDEIHILSGKDSDITKHYKWNGTSWTSVSTIPSSSTSAGYQTGIVYDNKIHIFERSSNGYHYVWDGTSWTSSTSMPFSVYSAVIYNNEIHIFGGGHYKWDGTNWVQASTLPYSATATIAVVYNGSIHIFGGMTSTYYKYHYKWNGASWTNVGNLQYDFVGNANNAIVYDNKINILGSNANMYHYIALSDAPATITSNGIYNIVGSKTETALDKLISNLTAKTAGSISVDIDMSATATADKIMSGYTAWVNGVKLTGTASGGGGGYIATGTASSTTKLTFSNLSIPYADIKAYCIICTSLSRGSGYYIYCITNVTTSYVYSSSPVVTAIYYSSGMKSNLVTSYISVSGSRNSITFTSSSSTKAKFITVLSAYIIMYC